MFSGVVLLAPMLNLEKLSNKGVNRYLRPIGELLNVVAPTWKVVKGAKSTMFPDLQEQFDKGESVRIDFFL